MSTRILDHIVHLTPPGSLAKTVEEWIGLGFNVIPGGVHADRLTENALVLLTDGVYIELISFTHELDYYPPGSSERIARETHAWASKAPGWIDYAFLGFGSSNPPPSISPDLLMASPPPLSDSDGDDNKDDSLSGGKEIDLADFINERAAAQGANTKYEKSVSGGRERTDGKTLRWKITAPEKRRHGRGVLPFFCGDVTSRELRVPLNNESTKHTNTARGVAAVKVAVPRVAYAEVEKQITSVVGVEKRPEEQTRGDDTDERKLSQWDLTTYVTLGKLPKPILILDMLDLELNSDSGSIDANGGGTNFVGGVVEVVFWAESGSREDKTPYGKIAWKMLREQS